MPHTHARASDERKAHRTFSASDSSRAESREMNRDFHSVGEEKGKKTWRKRSGNSFVFGQARGKCYTADRMGLKIREERAISAWNPRPANNPNPVLDQQNLWLFNSRKSTSRRFTASTGPINNLGAIATERRLQLHEPSEEFLHLRAIFEERKVV